MIKPIPMPFDGKDVPHLVIEVNQRCNLNCKACYKVKQGYTKPIELIKEEIDYGVSQRNLDVITLAGGEPTMHPDLAEAISYISKKGIKVTLLTNGLELGAAKLRRYGDAGLTRVLVHVDSMQDRPDAPPGATEEDCNAIRERILRQASRYGIQGGMAVTAYGEKRDDLTRTMEYALRSPFVSLVLMTCYGRFAPIAEKLGNDAVAQMFRDTELEGNEMTSREVAMILSEELDLDPTQYIESSLRKSEWRWLLYLGFSITDSDGKVDSLFLSSRYPRTIKLGNDLQKIFNKGSYKFDMVPSRAGSIAVCALYGLLGLDPFNLLKTARFLSKLAKPGAVIGSKVFVVQQPPTLTEEGELEYCKNCPDATVRNGEIMPLCTADIVSPVPSS